MKNKGGHKSGKNHLYTMYVCPCFNKLLYLFPFFNVHYKSFTDDDSVQQNIKEHMLVMLPTVLPLLPVVPPCCKLYFLPSLPHRHHVTLPSRVRRISWLTVWTSGWELPTTPSIWIPIIWWFTARLSLCSIPFWSKCPSVPRPASRLPSRPLSRAATACWTSRISLPESSSHASCRSTYNTIRCPELW